MASNINPYNVDGTFPIAGQDNSSQGFRDNFTNIKNNLIFAQNEINDLQSKAILTSALNGQTISNDMAGTVIRRPQLAAWTQTLLDLGAVSSNATLDFNAANFQKITTAGDIAIDFINWPTSTGAGSLGYGSMRVWIRVGETGGTPHTISLPTSVSIGVDELAGFANGTIIFDSIGDYIFDFSSIDGGSNYLVQDITRNHSTLRDPSFYFNDTVNATVLIGYNEGLPVALELEQGQDMVSARGSYNSVAIGDLSLANIAYSQTDTGGLGGYSVSASRGNISTGVFTPIASGDYLGYVNAIGYTGSYYNGVTQDPEFQQLASMNFFATGSNVAYGLGGNVAFFTARDGTTDVPNTLYQALGIENDQTVRVFGDLQTDGGYVERGTIITSLATTGAATINANTHVSTIIIDSVNSTTIANANIALPSGADDKQCIRISSVAPIGNANVYAPLGAGVKFVPFNFFATGNVGLTLTYNSSNSTWYRS